MLKEDIAMLKEDIAMLKEDIAMLKEDILLLKRGYTLVLALSSIIRNSSRVLLIISFKKIFLVFLNKKERKLNIK